MILEDILRKDTQLVDNLVDLSQLQVKSSVTQLWDIHQAYKFFVASDEILVSEQIFELTLLYLCPVVCTDPIAGTSIPGEDESD